MNTPRRIPLVCALALLTIVIACTTVPITGRSRLLLISDAEMVQFARQSRAQEFAAYNRENRIMQASESDTAARLISDVKVVAGNIIRATGNDPRAWRVGVVKASNVNANASADGTIVVYTGILPVAKTKAGLAAILGHEVAHVIARHQAERLSQTLLAQGITQVGTALADPKYRPAVGAALGLGARYGVLLPYSRTHESEADHLGLYFMAKAGYDPAEAVALWQRMAASGGSQPPEFLSTHPSHETRIAQLEQWLPDARRYFEDQTLPLPTSLTNTGQ